MMDGKVEYGRSHDYCSPPSILTLPPGFMCVGMIAGSVLEIGSHDTSKQETVLWVDLLSSRCGDETKLSVEVDTCVSR